jgi:hypothetical protein
MITNTKIFGNNLDRDISKIFFDGYRDYPAEHNKVAKILTAPPGNDYTESELSPLGDLKTVLEGQGVEFDLPAQGNKVTRFYTKYGLGFQITEEMWKDDLQRQFMKMPSKLAKSAAQKKETVFWDLFNRGFTVHKSWDDQFIFDSHTTIKSEDTITNEGTAAALSETSLQAGFEYYDALVDEAGNPIMMTPNMLIIPKELRFTGGQLTKNMMNLASANRDLNTINPGNNMVDDYQLFISRYLTSSTAWFLMSPDHDFRILWKQQPVLDSSDDFLTNNALFKVFMRFSAFCNMYKGGFGNLGA